MNEFRKYAVKHVGLNGTTVDDVINHQINSVSNYGLTPMILEERKLNVTQLSVFDRMMLDRILWVSGIVDDRMSDIVQAQLLFLESIDSDKDITMMISTPGGSVNDGLSIRDVMNYVKCDIATTNIGMAASMGSILLSSGEPKKRSGLINSKVMIHHVSSGAGGVIDDMRISLIEAEKYNYLLLKILAENCNKTFGEMHDLSLRDKWFNSDEALKFNLIDNIIGIDKHKNITDMMSGFDEYYQKYVIGK